MTLAGTCLAVSEKAGVETLPGIVQHLETNLLEDVLLVFVAAALLWVGVAIFSGFEAIVAPEGKVKGELLLDSRVKVIGNCCFSFCHLYAKLVLSIDLG